MTRTIDRLTLSVFDATYALAPTEHADDLKAAITHQLRAGGGFVDITVDDGRRISILITSASIVTVAATTVCLDAETADGPDHERQAPTVDDMPYDLF